MSEPLPDPKLRRALEKVDALEKELRTANLVNGQLRHRLKVAVAAAAAAKPVQAEVRAG